MSPACLRRCAIVRAGNSVVVLLSARVLTVACEGAFALLKADGANDDAESISVFDFRRG